MRFVVNTNGEVINGTLGEDSFSVLYTQELFKDLTGLQEVSETVETVEDLKALIAQAKTMIDGSKAEMNETRNPYLFLNPKTKAYHLKINDVINDMPIPQILVDRILLSMDKGLDYMPVIKMMARFLRNPKVLDGNMDFVQRFANYVDIKVVNPELVASLMDEKGFSKEVAIEMAKMYSIPITKEGMLLTYKVSEEIDWKYEFDKDDNKVKTDLYPKKRSIDPISGLITTEEPDMPMAEERLFQPAVMGQSGDAFYCVSKDFDGDFSKYRAAHVIKVGCIVTHDTWDKIDCNDNRSGVPGLHAGGQEYIRCFQNGNTQTHNVVIDPMDIGAICDDNTGAMRVLRYFVLDVFKGVNNSIYHSSTYAKFTDSEFQKFIKKSIDDHNEAMKNWKEGQDKTMEQVNSLV